MKGKLLAITLFATVDALFAGFAVGFNGRHALVGDPSIPAPARQEAPAPAPAAKPEKASDLSKKNGKKEAKVKPAVHAKATPAKNKTPDKPAAAGKDAVKPAAKIAKVAKPAATKDKPAGKTAKPQSQAKAPKSASHASGN